MPKPAYSRDDISPVSKSEEMPASRKPQPQPTSPFKPGSGKGNNGSK